MDISRTQINIFIVSLSFQFLVAFVPGTCHLHAQSGLQKFDERILLNLQDSRTPAKTGVFRFVSNSIHYGNIGVPAGLLIFGIANHDRQMRQNAIYVASSTASSYLFTTIIKLIVKRPRPQDAGIAGFKPVYRAAQFSFPSGHTSTSFATATALSIAYPKWYAIAPSFMWASSVGYSRMYLGAHYPTDVAGGAFLGAGTSLSLQFIKNK